MSRRRDALVLYDDRMLAHKPQVHDPFLPGRLEKRVREILAGLEMKWSYPEHPGRLTAVRDLLEAEPIEGLRFAGGAVATREQIGRVHTAGFLDHIYAMRGGSAWLDVDTTAVSQGSVEAAEVAAGTAIAAVEAVVSGQAESAFALVRPPGHHAEPGRARGFCLFNNVAIATRAAQAEHDVRRVLIIDWDVHHGNGTQDIFYDDADVYYLSLHLAGHYPGTGSAGERGTGAGAGSTLNVPLAAGTSAADYRAHFDAAVEQAFREGQPELVIVSAGYDCLAGDPLGGLRLEPADMHALTRTVMKHTADAGAHGPVVALEGGYVPKRVGDGVVATMRALGGLPADADT